MDIKVEYEHHMLCHGCLAEDRTVYRTRGELCELFYLLRNDNHSIQRNEPVLCWECVAFLNKLKMFKKRIQTAQCLLMQYLQFYYKTDSVSKPKSLSRLKKLHINTFHYKFYEEHKNKSDLPHNALQGNDEKKDIIVEFKEQDVLDTDKKKDLNAEELLKEIKIECNDSIKEEFNSSNDNDSDYDGPVLEIEEKNESEGKSSTVKKYTWKKKNYEIFATVTRRRDILKQNYMQFVEFVTLDHKEYDKVLKRDQSRYGYPRMPFKCDECKEGYLKKTDYQRHQSYFHSDKLKFPYKCAACSTLLTSLEHQDQHWTDSHSVLYKCTLCSEVHQSSFEVRKHIKLKHRKNYTCKECGLDYRSLPDFREHYKKMHETVVCDYCDMQYTRKKSLISHMRHFHIPAYCKLCNRTYANHKSFKHHNQVTHPELTAGETRKDLSYCVECDKQYPSVYKYRRHLQQSARHTRKEKRKYGRVPCPDCGKVFSRTNFMKNHYKFAHLKVTKNYCDQCDKYYTTGYGLRQHIERVHKKIALPKDKMCDLCGRGFGTNKILENHRRTHTGERPYKCKYCPAAFAQQTAMKTHQKSQHKNLDLSSQ